MTMDTRKKNGQGQLMGTPMNKPEAADEAVELEFTPPQDAELKGDKGTATVNWRRKEDGRVCITAINGVSLGGEADDSNEEHAEERDMEEVQPVQE